MKRMRGALLLGCAGLLSAAAAQQAIGQCLYDVTVIETPDFGCPEYLSSSSFLSSVNDLGQGAGNTIICVFTGAAFVWSPKTGYELLPFPASGVDGLTNGGLIAGTWWTDSGLDGEPYLFDGQQVTSLGAPPGATYCWAEGINEQGWVVGRWGNVQTGPQGAFLWHDGVMSDLSPDLGTPRSDAWDINDLGQVTGEMGTNLNDGHAFIWDDGAVTVLPFVPGGFTSRGYAINNRGDVAGFGKTTNPSTGAIENRGFVYMDGQMTVLEPFPGDVYSQALAINDARHVLGRSFTSSSERTFIWQDGVQTDLNDLITASASVIVKGALSINNAGQIGGSGRIPGVLEGAALLLTPQAPPQADLNHDCHVGVLDLLAILASWGVCPVDQDCPADFNGDGTVNWVDLMMLLVDWS